MNNHLIAPSILAADFANLERDIKMVNESEADWFHIDVMDGRFVPNISFGQPVIKAIAKHANKPLDVHLMIEEPEKYISDFRDCGAEIISVHYETCNHLHRVLQQIKDTGAKASVAINPHTNVNLLYDVLDLLDMVCIMSVNPGFGGQKFIANTYQKVSHLKEMLLDKNPQTLIEIDGGVNTENAGLLIEAGADVLVAGSAVFKSENPLETIKELKSGGNHTI